MRAVILSFLLSVCLMEANAQFAPPAGQSGSTAIHKDSSVFVSWATGCTVVRGYQDISNPSLGYASTGDNVMALGKADGTGVVSLGDGGYAILTFDHPISDGPGWDFAVFESSFSDDFLELAFVEVSSDGIHYYRFPATSYTQDTLQVGSFGVVDATKIDNLAGKYRALYGTPFDLQVLSSQPGLNINAITHVKIIDVIGCIQDTYATYDQYGHKINDPWHTPFASSGFDLDAVGVMYQSTTSMHDLSDAIAVQVYPNPANGNVLIQNDSKGKIESIMVMNSSGQMMVSIAHIERGNLHTIDVSLLPAGMYLVRISNEKTSMTKKIIIKRD